MPLIVPKMDPNRVPDRAERLEIISNKIRQFSTECVSNLAYTHKEIHDMVWNNRFQVPPQEILDALGTDASELFALADLLVQTVNQVVPNTIVPSYPYEITINPDGTVTLGDPV